METSTLVEVISLFIGTGGLAGFLVAIFTVRWQRSKVKSEAHGAKYDGMKVEQDTYQELIEDLNNDRKRMREDAEEREAYIKEIKEDRRILREEKKELYQIVDKQNQKIAEQDKKITEQDNRIYYLERMVDVLKPMLCANVNCTSRQTNVLGLVSDDSFDTKEKINEAAK